MKILQTIAGFGKKSGGTSTCTYDLLTALHWQGCEVDLMTFTVKDPTDRLMGEGEAWIKALPNDGVSPYGYSINMNRFLKDSDYDLYHTNGMWMHCNHETCVVARKKRRPYVITPHGMLYPQALARASWKKKLLLVVGGVNKDLKKAACIHVTCKAEMEHYRELGYINPVAVIPNPVPIPLSLSSVKEEGAKKGIGYLGRLHPYKRPDALIKAWALLKEETLGNELVLMGKGTVDYEMYLQKLVDELKLKNVRFLGMVTDNEKFKALSSLRALCVPSKTENFGMTVAEALIAQTPVICTKTAPWEALNTHYCGWWVENDVDTLAQTIRDVLNLPEEVIKKMGENGFNLVKENFSDVQIAKKMKRLYGWLINGGEKPEFVYE